MEVHAHTHTPRRKWTHYFWEFLMLFLAVFCGFLAEYQLEHTIENQREKIYIQSLTSDLRADTAEIKNVIAFNIDKFRGLDTLIIWLGNDTLSEPGEKELYRLNRKYATNIYAMIFSDRTMRQLLNSGNMRLIGNLAISDSIMSYYGQAKDDVIAQEKVYQEMSMRLLFTAEDIFDGSGWRLKIKGDNSFYWEPNPEKIKLSSRDRKLFKKYSNMVANAQSMLALYIEMLFDMKERSSRLLLLLKEKYHLK